MADKYTGEHKRAYENSLVWRLAIFFGKWSWVTTPLMAVFVAVGFGFNTPNARFNQIDTKINALNLRADTVAKKLTQVNKAGAADRADMRLIIEFLARSQCVAMSPHDKQISNGTQICDDVLHPLDHAIKAGLRPIDEENQP